MLQLARCALSCCHTVSFLGRSSLESLKLLGFLFKTKPLLCKTQSTAIIVGEAELQPLVRSQPTTFLTCAPQGVHTQGAHCVDAVTSPSSGNHGLLLTYAVTACETCGLGAGHSTSADAPPGSHMQEAVSGLCSCYDRL